jgi:hypothetical protein
MRPNRGTKYEEIWAKILAYRLFVNQLNCLGGDEQKPKSVARANVVCISFRCLKSVELPRSLTKLVGVAKGEMDFHVSCLKRSRDTCVRIP